MAVEEFDKGANIIAELDITGAASPTFGSSEFATSAPPPGDPVMLGCLGFRCNCGN